MPAPVIRHGAEEIHERQAGRSGLGRDDREVPEVARRGRVVGRVGVGEERVVVEAEHVGPDLRDERVNVRLVDGRRWRGETVVRQQVDKSERAGGARGDGRHPSGEGGKGALLRLVGELIAPDRGRDAYTSARRAGPRGRFARRRDAREPGRGARSHLGLDCNRVDGAKATEQHGEVCGPHACILGGEGARVHDRVNPGGDDEAVWRPSRRQGGGSSRDRAQSAEAGRHVERGLQ